MQVSIAGTSRSNGEVQCFSFVDAIDHFLNKLQTAPEREHTKARPQKINTITDQKL